MDNKIQELITKHNLNHDDVKKIIYDGLIQLEQQKIEIEKMKEEEKQFELLVEKIKQNYQHRHTIKKSFTNGDIEYELYPYQQCREIPVEVMVPNIKTVCPKVVPECAWHWNVNGKKLTVGLIGEHEPIYVVYDNDKEISCFVDYSYSYQEGDGDTRAFVTEDNEFVIDNMGDISSLVILKYKPS